MSGPASSASSNRKHQRGARRARLLIAFMVTAASTGCRSDGRDVIEAWLTCIDCTDGERQAVVAFGARAVPYLSQAVLGPGALRVAGADQIARRAYARIASPATPESTFVRNATNGFVASYQSRAAMSLGDIGGQAAVVALQTALGHDSTVAAGSSPSTGYYRADARRWIEVSLARAESDPFPNLPRTTVHRFHDTVVVRASASAGLSGREAKLVGSPFADRVVVQRWADDSLAVIAAARTGLYALQLIPSPGGGRAWVTRFEVVSSRYETRNPNVAWKVPDAGFPWFHFPLIGAAGSADSADYFMLNPSDTTEVSVQLEWLAPGDLHMAWYECPTGPGVSPLLILEGRPGHPSSSEVRIPAGRCVLLGLTSRSNVLRTPARLAIRELPPGGGGIPTL